MERKAFNIKKKEVKPTMRLFGRGMETSEKETKHLRKDRTSKGRQ